MREPGLSSALLRAVLCVIQRAALAREHTSMRAIAQRLGRSTSVVQRYCRALRESGHIVYEDGAEGSIRVKEWL